MNFLAIFQPHLRLIYVFLCGLIVSTMTHISTLIILNLVVFRRIIYCANTLSKIPCRLFQILAETKFFHFTCLVDLKLENHRARFSIKSNGDSARTAHHATFQFDFKFNSTLVN